MLSIVIVNFRWSWNWYWTCRIFWDWHTIFYWNNSSAGGSNFGLKPALARRELGDEVVQLAEMWLGSIRGDAVEESGKEVLNGHCGGGDFIDWLFCLVLFFWVQLLWRYNWLKWKKKRKSTGGIRGTVGCINSCWIRNCIYDTCCTIVIVNFMIQWRVNWWIPPFCVKFFCWRMQPHQTGEEFRAFVSNGGGQVQRALLFQLFSFKED